MRRRTLILSAAALGAAPFVQQATAASISVVERFAETLTAHDLDAFAALFADDYVNHQLSAAAPPPAGMPSKTATLNFFAARLKGLPDLKVSIQASLADADKVAASFLYEGTQQGPLYGVAPTGSASPSPRAHLSLKRRQDRRTLGHGRHRGRAGPAQRLAAQARPHKKGARRRPRFRKPVGLAT